MRAIDTSNRDRVVAAAGAVGLQLVLLYALVTGLAVNLPGALEHGLKLFAVLPDRPPPPPKTHPPHIHDKRPQGASAPPNLRSTASEIVAPPPVVRVIVPPPVIAAPVAGTGSDPSAGASDHRGPGTGSGGLGTGTGSGGFGDGDGGGDETPPRLKKGRIKDSDYPRGAAAAGAGGTVSVRYRVETDGRVTGCVITGSSGNADLDETTCRLIEQRFRYEPSRDADGRPVVSYIVRDNEWVIDRAHPVAAR